MSLAVPKPDMIDGWINQWIGVPHVWDGRDLHGVDCYGLVWRFYLDCYGVTLPDWRRDDLARQKAIRQIAENVPDHWHPLPVRQEPCVAMAMQAGRAHHMGIAWRNGIVHANEAHGVEWLPLPRFVMAMGWPQWGFIT